jgi:hypothetical protein
VDELKTMSYVKEARYKIPCIMWLHLYENPEEKSEKTES